MNKIPINYTEAQLEKLVEKRFIEWLIDNLTPDEMMTVIGGIDMEVKKINGRNPPKLFLKNKLLIKSTRIKLRDNDVFPPFNWIMEIEGEITKESLLKVADSLNVPKREISLSLFLQNYYDEALQIYETRNGDEQIVDKKQGGNAKTEPIQESEISGKIEKKLGKKLSNLEAERDKLQQQLKTLQQEVKDKLTAKQNEINRLNALLITEKKETEIAREKALADAEVEKEKIINEVNFLKKENDQLKLKSKTDILKPQELGSKKTKLALLGDPKNKSILKNEKYTIEVFEHKNFQEVLDREKEFKSVYLLTWRFSIEEFEIQANSEVRKKTTAVNSFVSLRKKLEELTNVN